jgi:hypothetical protein
MRSAPLTILLGLIALAAPATAGADVLHVFPNDKLTKKDERQVTGRRVALPLPNCEARASDCNDRRLLNQLDGFDVDPRVEIRFDRPIDLAKVTPATLYLQKLRGGPRIGVNRIVWSPARNALYAQPQELLEESTRYRIVVARALGGRRAIARFTTLTATAALRKMRAQLDDGSAYERAGIAAQERGLDFVRPDGTRTVFNALGVLAITRFNDTGPGALRSEIVPNTAVLGAGQYAFGSFLSPSWLDADRTIPNRPTRTGTPAVTGREEVGFTMIVPSGAKPEGGWPVAVFGPGITRSKYDLFLAADENASRGIATAAIDPVGHGLGPRSEVSVDTLAGSKRFSGFGRGRDLDSDGTITTREGVQAPDQPHPKASIALRDGLRQTALDNMAFVRAIARGVDVDGDGSIDLRRDRVGYYAQSLGGIYGTMLMATDQTVPHGLLNVPGGPILEIARLSPSFREEVTAQLGDRRPSLLNGGREGFTESTPLYVDPPVTAPARGAVAIQDTAAMVNWLDRSGSPETFAPLLRRRPAPGVGPKRVAYQIAFGDQTVPNPTSATIVRAGGLLDVTTLYRNDRTPTAGSDPHGFLLDPRITGRNLGQRQVVELLDSEGASIVDPDGGSNVFETPVADPLSLERLNFALGPASGEPPAEAALRPLRLTVAPRRVRAGRRVRLSVRVTTEAGARRRAVRRAVVRVGGRRTRTNRRGRAVLAVRFRRAGRQRAVASRKGFFSGYAAVRVLRRRHR